MGLCGSSFCGCAITSVPADFAEFDGAFPTIDVAGNGTGATPWNLPPNDEWAGGVATTLSQSKARLDAGAGVWAVFTPVLTNVNVGTGGSATNTARYTFVGGDAAGSEGILHVTGDITLGTSGFSVEANVRVSLPVGFEARVYPASVTRLGLVTLVSSNIGVVSWVSGTTVGFVVFNSSSTYLSVSGITATVPATWAAGHYMRYSYTLAARRV